MNDRQRIEALIMPIILKNILMSGARKDEHYDAACKIMDDAMGVVLPKDEKRKAQIIRRLVRTHDAVTDPTRKGGVSVDKIALTTLYLLQTVLDAGYLELDEGSALSEVVHAIMHAFGDAFAQERLDASAKKAAAKMLSQLQGMGLFEGITFRQEAA